MDIFLNFLRIIMDYITVGRLGERKSEKSLYLLNNNMILHYFASLH